MWPQYRRLVLRALAALLAAMVLVALAPAATAAPSQSASLQFGARGLEVQQIQQALANAGFDAGGVDGQFGPRTRAAVMRYQAANGLAADGIVGPRTWAALIGGTRSASSSSGELSLGSRGAEVQKLQSALAAAGFDPGPIDGQFGRRTRAAVVAFQGANGLATDGRAGPKTQARLYGGATTPPPAASPPPAPPAPTPAPADPEGTPSDATWDQIAQCESGGRWDLNTGNGYYGGLQFSLGSWQWVGGQGMPHEASRAEQIHRADLLWLRQGWDGWPTCSRRLGLR